jgi:hypothetical protein
MYKPNWDENAKVWAKYPSWGLRPGDVIEAVHIQEIMVSVEVADPLACPEDINGDGVINITDLGFLLAAFGSACP